MITTDRPLPHDLMAERAVLGAVLLHNDVLTLAAETLTPGDFFRDAHRRLFATMSLLHEEGAAIDLVTLRAQLSKDGSLDEIGGPAYIASLTEGLPKGTNVAHYAHIVRERARSRRIIDTTTRILRDAYEDEESPEQQLERADAALSALRETQTELSALGPEQQWIALVDSMRRAPQTRIYLGIPSLDNLLRGIHPGEVIAVMARPSVGKTLILGHMLRAIAETEYGAFVFSLEMPADQIICRLARAVYGMNRDDIEEAIRSGALDGGRYVRALPRTVLIDTPGLSLAKMETAVRNLTPRMLGNEPPRVVIIDHLGLIGGDRALSTYDRVSTQARECKELAKRHHVAVILAVQVNREIGGDGSKELTLGAARDSGVVEEAMDYIVGCRRLDYCQALTMDQRQKYDGAIFLKVLKNRHGELGRELCVRIDPKTLDLREDLDLHAETVTEVGQFRSRR